MNTTDTLAKIANELHSCAMSTDPSNYTLAVFADRIEALDSDSPYAGMAVKALRRADWNTAVGFAMVAARA